MTQIRANNSQFLSGKTVAMRKAQLPWATAAAAG
jgi:hypothetical protein